MKTPQEIIATITAKLSKDWQLTFTAPDTQKWPRRFSIGKPTGGDVAANYVTLYQPCIDEWTAWSHAHAGDDAVRVGTERRKVGRLTHPFPTYVEVDSLVAAAALVGGPWSETVARGGRRHAALGRDIDGPMGSGTLRAVTDLSDVDFELLHQTVLWWKEHAPVTGLTARQVPIPGLHAKWLDKHGALVRTLLGVDTLGLIDRPHRMNLTYLDPQWLAHGGRRRDSLADDDPAGTALGYQPQTVIITENRDTALFFPPVPDGVAIEGVGDAIVKRLTMFSWFRQCPRIVYWGDIDADGYEIVDALRQVHPGVATILMDMDAYTSYEVFGVRVDQHGKHLKPVRKVLPHLTAAEARVYDLVTDLEHGRALRIEQERIPLTVAADVLHRSQVCDRGHVDLP